jgi:hypothetical protein
VGEKRAGMRGIPGLGIGIVNQLADNLRQMGGAGRTPMAATRFSPRPQLAFCTGYRPLGRGSSAGPELNNGHPYQPFSAGHDRV